MAQTNSYAEELIATANDRRYRVRRGAHSRLFIEEQNRFDGTWKLVARDSSENFRRIVNMVRRGWAVMVSNEE